MQTLPVPAAPQSAPDITFGARLAAARRAADLTQEQLGKGMGSDGRDLGKGAVSSWEQNGSQPNATQLRMLCERLGCTADWLLFGKAE